MRGSHATSDAINNTIDPQLLHTLPAHSDPVAMVRFSPDGSLLLSASWDGLVRLWDVGTGQCLQTILDNDNPPVSGAQWLRNSQGGSVNRSYILANTLDDRLRVWSLQTGKCVRALRGHLGRRFSAIPAMVTGPDNQHIVVCTSEDGRLVWWNLSSVKKNTTTTTTNEEPEGSLQVLSQPLLGLDILGSTLLVCSGLQQEGERLSIYPLKAFKIEE